MSSSIRRYAMIGKQHLVRVVLAAALLCQAVLAPGARGWSAPPSDFERELLASLCSQQGHGKPEVPGNDHCPDLPCCLFSGRSGSEHSPAILGVRPAAPLPKGLPRELRQMVQSDVPRVRVSSSPGMPRAPPA